MLRSLVGSEMCIRDREGSGVNMNIDFLYKLDDARRIAGTPFKINSGYRTPEHNAKVGGVESSSHTRGYAADISVGSSSQRYKILTALIEAGFNRIGVYKTFIHCDCDPDNSENVIWYK